MKKLYTLVLAAAASMTMAAATSFQSIDGICGAYQWTDAMGELDFNITVKADADVANGVIINNLFGEYEVKGTVDAEGNISIPSKQDVGYDWDNLVMHAFVHLSGDGQIDESDLVLEYCDDKDGKFNGFQTFEEYAIIEEDFDGTYHVDKQLKYGYMGFLDLIAQGEDAEWESAGVAVLYDGGFFTPLPRFNIGFKDPVEVDIEKSILKEGVYRLVEPWGSHFGKTLGTYLEFDISDPECVIIPTQATGVTDDEYGAASVQNFIGMYVAGGFGKEAGLEIAKESEICKYNAADMRVDMPVGAAFTTFAKEANAYWNVGAAYGARPSYIVMPGGKAPAGVDGVVADDADAPVEYFNLQGMRVDNPCAGQLVIRRQGNSVAKIVR